MFNDALHKMFSDAAFKITAQACGVKTMLTCVCETRVGTAATFIRMTWSLHYQRTLLP